MNECDHKLNLVRNLLCSEVIPATCNKCGNKVVRIHKTAGYLADGLFAAMGIPYLALVFVLFDYLPWVIAGTVLIILTGYMWDTVTTDLVIYSEELKDNYRKRSTNVIIITVVIILAVLVVGANGA